MARRPLGTRRLTGAEAPAPAPMESLTDDLVAAILIRVPTLNDLGCAACACPAFRRVIADPAFLRRVRASHPPLLLGFLLNFKRALRAVDPPYPSAPAARAVTRAADFSFSFLPDLLSPSPLPSRRWEVRDARDGRVLLRLLRNDGQAWDAIFAEVAVCDPLFRRFVVLPPIPDDLASAIEQPHVVWPLHRRFEVFLVPLLRLEEEETSFRVVWMAQCPTKLVTFIFSSVTGQWQPVASPTLQDLNPAMPSVDRPVLLTRSYAYGCFYWRMFASRNFLVLDMARMEFSLLECPPSCRWHQSVIVETEEGRLGIFSFNHARFGKSFQLETFSTIRPYQAEGPNEWKYIKEAVLPSHRHQVLGVANGRLLIMQHEQPLKLQVRSIVLNTDYETVCGTIDSEYHPPPLPFLGYPPSLSSPSICASVPEEDDLQEPALLPTESG